MRWKGSIRSGHRQGPPDVAGRRWAVLAVLCVSLLVVSIDNTILNVALPTIVRSLHASSGDLQWTIDAYAVVFAGLLLTSGSLGDRYGRKRVFNVGLVLFGIGSAASALSSTPHLLIASRAFMGIGAAAIMPSTLSILTNVFSDDAGRARAIGIWSGTTGLGMAIGPIAGGWLLAHYWWGSVFLVNVPIVAVGLVASVWLVPDSRDPAGTRPDPMGAVLSTAGLGLVLWGIIEAPSRSWTSPVVMAAVAAGILVLWIFVAWERRCDHAMLDLTFFSSRRFSAAMAALALVVFSLMGMLFILTQWLQFSLGLSPLDTGLRMGPIALVLVVVAPVSSVLAHRVGTKMVVTAGMVAIAVGLALLSRTGLASSYGAAVPALMLIGVGSGLAFAPATEAVMGSLPAERSGVGAATNSAGLQVGGALGVGILGSALSTRFQGHLVPVLAGHHLPAAIEQLVVGSLGGALAVAGHVGGPIGAALAAVSRRAFMSGMDLALAIGSVAVLVGVVVVAVALPSWSPDTAKTRGRRGPVLGGVRLWFRLGASWQRLSLSHPSPSPSPSPSPHSNSNLYLHASPPDPAGPLERAVAGHGPGALSGTALERPRVLLEMPDAAEALACTQLLASEGYDVMWCPGPQGRPRRPCPLVGGGHCSLLDVAHVVVSALDHDDPLSQGIRGVLGNRSSRVPVVVARPRPLPGREDRRGPGDPCADMPLTGTALVAAVGRAIDQG